MGNDAALRAQLKRVVDWDEAHADFGRVVSGLPAAKQGVVPTGLPHSAWQLLEHLRIAIADIHDFCVNPQYQHKHWPDDYWPAPEPPTATAWDECAAAYRRELEKMRMLVDAQPDLFASIPHGTSPHQTYLRAALLVADHSAYHLGQIVLVRQLLGEWPPK